MPQKGRWPGKVKAPGLGHVPYEGDTKKRLPPEEECQRRDKYGKAQKRGMSQKANAPQGV